MAKKLLFIATRPFWPASSGKEVTLYYNCKGLHEKCGYDIYLLCFKSKKDSITAPPDFIHKIEYIQTPGIVKAVPIIMWKSILMGQWPIQSSLFYQPTIAKKIKNFFTQIKPDVLIIDMVRLSPYIDSISNISIPHILIEEDLLAKRYMRQLNAANTANISGYISTRILNQIFNAIHIKALILNIEIKLLERYEGNLIDKFDYITFISPVETKEYNQKYNTNKAITLTMGADIEYCAGGEPNEHLPNSLSVVGNFAYGPNAASLEWIDKNVMPFLPENITYYVVGKCPRDIVKKVESKKIKFTGFVDDYRKTVKSTDIYFAPIVYGTGIKTKIVEALAMGMPVVTNSVGVEGLNVKNGEELFIEDDPQKMVGIIKMLLKNKELCKKIGQKGQDYIRKNHDWKNIYNVFSKMGL